MINNLTKELKSRRKKRKLGKAILWLVRKTLSTLIFLIIFFGIIYFLSEIWFTKQMNVECLQLQQHAIEYEVELTKETQEFCSNLK